MKSNNCGGNCGSTTECWLVCGLRWCHQPELVEMAPLLALTRGTGNSQAAQAAVTSCQWGTGSKRNFCFLWFAFSRNSTVNGKAQSYTTITYLMYLQVFSLGVPATLLQKQSFPLLWKQFSCPNGGEWLHFLPRRTRRELPVWVYGTSLVVGATSPAVICCPGETGAGCLSEEGQSSESNDPICPGCRTTSLWMNYGGSCRLIKLNIALREWHPTMAAMLYPAPWTTCPSPRHSTAKVTFNFFLSHHMLPPLSPVRHSLLSLCKAASAPLFFVFPWFASDNRSCF